MDSPLLCQVLFILFVFNTEIVLEYGFISTSASDTRDIYGEGKHSNHSFHTCIHLCGDL